MSLARASLREESRYMSRLRCPRLLAVAIVCVLPLGVLAPSCTSSNTSAVGQRISCTVTGTGVTACHPVDRATAGSGSGTCEDVDEDGDGSPHDVGEDHHDPRTGRVTGTEHAGSATDDDDGDGIENERDCDKRHGGDDDGSDHDGSDDDGSGSGDGSGSDDGSGHH